MNKYEIIDQIGEGEYGVVLKAKNKETGDLVAIKKFKEDDSNEQNKKVILRQVKILKTLSHDNIIELKEAFRKKGKIYLVCEYVEKNLLEILEEGSISPNQARQYIYQLLKGIAYMHSLNIIHRDVKPENVLISKEGSVKICDLGFARTMPNNKVMTDYVATRWYRPPQLLIGKDDYDKSIDVWSIGCVMAEIIDGQPLFPGENDLDQLYLIQKCLGPLTVQHHEHFLKNPKFIGMKFPEIHNVQTIERRYFGKIDKYGLDLLKKMLKMEPKQRITPEEALTHPYFQRGVQLTQTETKRMRVDQEERHYDDLPSDNHIVTSNNMMPAHHKVPVNNFIEEKINSNNKVTGLLKLKNKHIDNISSLRQNNLLRQEQAQGIQNKGKSLGNKKVSNIVKEKYGPITDKKGRNGMKSRVPAPKKNFIAQEEEYYEQKWEEAQEQAKVAHKDKSQLFSKQPKDLDSPSRKQQLRKSKFLPKNIRKDNFNIVFNNNTYNLNLIDPYN